MWLLLIVYDDVELRHDHGGKNYLRATGIGGHDAASGVYRVSYRPYPYGACE